MRSTLLLTPLFAGLLFGCSKPDVRPDPPAAAEPSSATATSAAAPSGESATPPASSAAASAPAVASGAASGVPAGGAADASACGKKPLPDCPLQGWMKEHTAPAMSAHDMPALAAAFQKIATFAPPGYENWASIAKDGAAAAQAGNADAVKAACRSCHQQYKSKYKTELRARPLP